MIAEIAENSFDRNASPAGKGLGSFKTGPPRYTTIPYSVEPPPLHAPPSYDESEIMAQGGSTNYDHPLPDLPKPKLESMEDKMAREACEPNWEKKQVHLLSVAKQSLFSKAQPKSLNPYFKVLPGSAVLSPDRYVIERNNDYSTYYRAVSTCKESQHGQITNLVIKYRLRDIDGKKVKREAKTLVTLQEIVKKVIRLIAYGSYTLEFIANIIVLEMPPLSLCFIIKADSHSDVEANAVGDQLFEALQGIHGAGYIHSRIGPSNIKFDFNQNLFVDGFDLATKIAKIEPEVDIKGTLRDDIQYMSSEVQRGRKTTILDELIAAVYTIMSVSRQLFWKWVATWRGMNIVKTQFNRQVEKNADDFKTPIRLLNQNSEEIEYRVNLACARCLRLILRVYKNIKDQFTVINWLYEKCREIFRGGNWDEDEDGYEDGYGDGDVKTPEEMKEHIHW